MKKLLVILLVLGLAAPALAAEWNFYGNARMNAFYTDTDIGDRPKTANVYDDKGVTDYDLLGSSRIGANVKVNDQIGGRFEYGAAGGGVNLRLLYGTYNFGNGTILVGQDYTPAFFVSGVTMWDDAIDNLGAGNPYAGRVPQLKLIMGGFKAALIRPAVARIPALALLVPGYNDSDIYLPKLEVSYRYATDTFAVYGYGGYQTLKLENNATDRDFSVNAWTLGAGVDLMFGPATINAQANFGQNYGAYGVVVPFGYQDILAAANGPRFKTGTVDDIEDSDAFQGNLIAGFKVSDSLLLEAGGVYTQYENDEYFNGSKAKALRVYGAAQITVVPGFFVTPEIGFIDYYKFNGVDQGDVTYAGVNFLINF